jgi:hypothetical protein
LHNEIAHLAEPFSKLDEHIGLLGRKIRSQRNFFFATMAVIVMVVVGASFLFDRNNRARFLDIQQAYQQFYSVNQAGNIEVSKDLRKSAEILTDISKKESERIIGRLEKKLEILKRNQLNRAANDNKKVLNAVKEENRKLLSILGDQNEHQMRIIEKLLQQEDSDATTPEPSP